MINRARNYIKMQNYISKQIHIISFQEDIYHYIVFSHYKVPILIVF